jgi:hypothetical protein
VARVDPLSPNEEALWRALMRIVLSLPRRLDVDLVRNLGITSNERRLDKILAEVGNYFKE